MDSIEEAAHRQEQELPQEQQHASSHQLPASEVRPTRSQSGNYPRSAAAGRQAGPPRRQQQQLVKISHSLVEEPVIAFMCRESQHWCRS